MIAGSGNVKISRPCIFFFAMSEKGRTFAPHSGKEEISGFWSSALQRPDANGNSRKETPRVGVSLFFWQQRLTNLDIMKVTINLRDLPEAARFPLFSELLYVSPVTKTFDTVSVEVDAFTDFLTLMWRYYANVSRGYDINVSPSVLMSFRYPVRVDMPDSGRALRVFVYYTEGEGIHYCYDRELRPAR